VNIEERRAFVAAHRTAVFGYPRAEHGPSMSILYYAMDGEDILIGTMAERHKAKAVRRDPRISLCVLDEQWPPSYLVLYCTATIEDDLEATVDLGMRVMAIMAGEEMPTSRRAAVERMVRDEDRVVIRLKPYMTFESPPRHVYKPDDVETLTHPAGATLPWTQP